MADTNWHHIEQAPRGVGPQLLRAGTSLNDPVFVGYQADDGRWFFGAEEVHPTHYCLIPAFDADDGVAA